MNRISKITGIPGLYTRRTANGERYQLKVQVCGKTKYRTLDVMPGASLPELIEAAEKARNELQNPLKTFDDYVSDYCIAKGLKAHSCVALVQALKGFSLDAKVNELAIIALQTSDYKPATVRAYMQRVSAFFRWLASAGVDIENPCKGRKIPKSSDEKGIEATVDQAGLLVDYIDSCGDDDDRLYVRLLRFTGARCSSVAALKCDSFTPAQDGFYIRFVNVKCSRAYKVDLLVTDAVTCGMIRDRIARGYIWQASENNLHMRLYKRMRRLFGEGITPHSLRHLFASELLKKGVSLDVISKLLDHSDISITLKTYAKHDQSQLDAAINNIGKGKCDE